MPLESAKAQRFTTTPTELHPILGRSESVQQAAEQLGFTCLDHEWKGWQVAYRFSCREGHQFLKRPRALLTTVGCLYCRQDAAFRDLQASVQKAAVQCQELTWLGSHAHHRFRCAQDHEWKRIGGHALHDASCPHCTRQTAGRRQYHREGLTRLVTAANKKGGVCLSTAYRGSDQRYRFRCREGHQWEALGTKILHGGWCPSCALTERAKRYLRTDGLEALKAIVVGKGGRLLETDYRGMAEKYRVQCGAGHVWETTGNCLASGTWCRRCYFEQMHQETLAVAHQLAATRDGKCLTHRYPGAHSKWQWLCHRGHSWQAVLSSVKQGHWCAECERMRRITKPNSKAWRRYQAALS